MTDKKPEAPQDERARSKSSVLTTPANKRAVPPGEAESTKPAGSRSLLAPAAFLLAAVSLGLSGAVWVKHQELQKAHADLLAGLSSNRSAAERIGSQVGEALEKSRSQDERIAALQAQVDDADAIIDDLDEALRIMTDRGSELVLLNDVDHLATIAQQQLQLGGNVRNAIVALESAQAQLARANRPSLASLLQTVNGDLDRLRAASTIDVGAFSSQLEELAMLLTEAPLIMPDESGRIASREEPSVAREQPAPTVPPAQSAEAPWWERAWETTQEWSRDAWDSVRNDLGQFIDVRRIDDAHALLMSPDQATRFRDSLRTRVMTAQLALMMRQPQVWNTEMQAIVKAIETRYDESSPLTRKALRMARNMADTTIDAQLPTVDNTLNALNALREKQDRGSDQPQAMPSEAGSPKQPGQEGAAAEGATTGEAPGGSSSADGTSEQAGSTEDAATDGAATEGTATEGAATEDAATEDAATEDAATEDAATEGASSDASEGASSDERAGEALDSSQQGSGSSNEEGGSAAEQPDSTPSATPPAAEPNSSSAVSVGG